MSDFKYIVDTPVLIEGKTHLVRMENGMTGIGSRAYWLDGELKANNIVTQSADITKGNHFLYTMKWRNGLWSWVDILIHEDELPVLLASDQAWRGARKIVV